jgi:elongation factor Tu
LKWRLENYFLAYDFPGDDIPIVKGSALAAVEGRNPEIGEERILELNGKS